MREKELEERMHAFLRGDADVLVSTTIIESGSTSRRRTR
jgi:Transcription-repair coupling factor (superfamily II helicase)